MRYAVIRAAKPLVALLIGLSCAAAQAEAPASRPAPTSKPTSPRPASKDPGAPEAGRFPRPVDWDDLSAQVIPRLCTNMGEAAFMTGLRSARCRIDVQVTSNVAVPCSGILRYAWDDADDNGILTPEEVQVETESVGSPDMAPRMEEIRKQFETQALCNTCNLFLLDKVQTAAKDDGYEVRLRPGGTRSPLQALGLTEMDLAVSKDFRVTEMRAANAEGARAVAQLQDRSIEGKWYSAGYARQTSLPNGSAIVETGLTTHAVVDGMPVTSQVSIMTSAAAGPGEPAVTVGQQFTFRDWKVVRRPRPLRWPGQAADKPEPVVAKSDSRKPVKLDKTLVAGDEGRKGAQSQPVTARRRKVPPMEKYISPQAYFTLYKPKGWIVREDTKDAHLIITVSNPKGDCQAEAVFGLNLAGRHPAAVLWEMTARQREGFRDFRFEHALRSADGKRMVVDTFHRDAARGPRKGRCWAGVHDEYFSFWRCEAPADGFDESRELLLSVLANIQVIRDTVPAPRKVLPLVSCRLADGSASFSLPQGWTFQDFGTCCFHASGPGGAGSFTVANVEMLTPQVGVEVPGAIVLPYLAPHRALETLAEKMGLLSDVEFQRVTPREDVAQMIGQVYTAGPVTVEEFEYTAVARDARCRGYTFGISWGSRLGYNWRFSHVTVTAPASEFDACAPTLAAMIASYRIDDAFAMKYIAEGTARLRRMQAETARIIAKNAQDIHDMMQAAYDERQRSQDYIDYLRTTYIRGESDWISGMEGGTVYHTDSWGTKNLTTGEYWEGQPHNYVHFEGRNPKYDEQMIQVTDRQLFEQMRRAGH